MHIHTKYQKLPPNYLDVCMYNPSCMQFSQASSDPGQEPQLFNHRYDRQLSLIAVMYDVVEGSATCVYMYNVIYVYIRVDIIYE